MAKRLALYLGAVGYIVGLARYPAFTFLPIYLGSPLTEFANRACIGCPNICPSPGLLAVILIAPIQAIIYGTVGFVIGKVIRRLRRPPG